METMQDTATIRNKGIAILIKHDATMNSDSNTKTTMPRAIKSPPAPETDAIISADRNCSGTHVFEVRISRCTREQAEQVLRERLGHDEDYGFPYNLKW